VSLCNAVIREDHALVAVDTDAVALNGQRRHASKLAVFPHARFVLAGRGSLNAIWSCVGGIGALCCDFDEARARLCDQARCAYHGAAMAAAQCGVPDAHANVELVLAGWSTIERAIVGTFVRRGDDGAWIATPLREAVHAAPWAAELGDKPAAVSESDLCELAQRQVRWHRQVHPNAACGGRLTVARVTREAIRIHDAGEIVEARGHNPFAAVAASKGWPAG
jgi:hypothetical protein